MKRVHVVVAGRVQGVFYRATCAGRARALGLAGWIRNMPDGGVEAEFEGEDGSVDAMVAWCAEGPAHAVVDAIRSDVRSVLGERGFRVVR